MLFVYTEHATPRLQYVCEFIFKEQLGLSYYIVEEENKLYTGILSQLQSDYLETIKLGDKYKKILEKMRRQMDSLNKKLSDIHKQIKIYETTLEKINKHIDKLTDELHKNIHGGNKIIYFKLSNVLL